MSYVTNKFSFVLSWVAPLHKHLIVGSLVVTTCLLALPTKAKDIVFRFIIEYSSLRDFYRPLGNSNRSIFI